MAINLTLMYDTHVNIAIDQLNGDGTISRSGKFKDVIHYKLYYIEGNAVDEVTEIWLSTRFLYLSSNNLHYKSKQD